MFSVFIVACSFPFVDLRNEWNQGLEKVDEAMMRGGGSIGSRPPSCNHKCGGCVPCEAVQVPTNSVHYGVQYANYQPEGWKCKCGALVYNP